MAASPLVRCPPAELYTPLARSLTHADPSVAVYANTAVVPTTALPGVRPCPGGAGAAGAAEAGPATLAAVSPAPTSATRKARTRERRPCRARSHSALRRRITDSLFLSAMPPLCHKTTMRLPDGADKEVRAVNVCATGSSSPRMTRLSGTAGIVRLPATYGEQPRRVLGLLRAERRSGKIGRAHASGFACRMSCADLASLAAAARDDSARTRGPAAPTSSSRTPSTSTSRASRAKTTMTRTGRPGSWSPQANGTEDQQRFSGTGVQIHQTGSDPFQRVERRHAASGL